MSMKDRKARALEVNQRLKTLYPDLPPPQGFGRLLQALVQKSQASTIPEPQALATGKYPRFPSEADFSRSLYK